MEDVFLEERANCPCGFVIHRGINCGSVTRADSISAITTSGIRNPRGQRDLIFDNRNDL